MHATKAVFAIGGMRQYFFWNADFHAFVPRTHQERFSFLDSETRFETVEQFDSALSGAIATTIPVLLLPPSIP